MTFFSHTSLLTKLETKMNLLRTTLLWGLGLLLVPAMPAWWQAGSAQTTAPSTPNSTQAFLPITARSAKELTASGNNIIWIDARSQAEFDQGHIPGALWLSPGHWPEATLLVLATTPKDQLIIIYCGGGPCRSAEETAQRLARELRLTNLRILRGGYPAWLRHQP